MSQLRLWSLVFALVTGFGEALGGGIVTTSLSSGTDRGFALALQPVDSRLLVAGLADYGVHPGFFGLVRYNTDGSLDASFGNGGIVITEFNGRTDVALAVLPTRELNVLVAGWAGVLCDFCTAGALALFAPNGELVTSFGGTGKVITAFGSDRDTQYLAATQDEDGRLVIVGYSGPSIFSVNHDSIVARYEADGSLDLGFAGQGYVRVNIGGHSDDFGTSVAIQSDGKIVIGGYSNALGDTDFVVLRFNPDGSVDSSFGDDGRVITDLGGVDRLLALKIQSDNKIAVAGFTYNPSSDFASVALARLNADGSLDDTFGDGGRSVPHFEPSLSERATSLDIQTDGGLVIAGYNGRFEMFLARFFADGSADASFGIGGYQIVHVGEPTAQSLAYGIVVQPDGNIAAAGYVAAPTKQDFAIIRVTPAGDLDDTFGS